MKLLVTGATGFIGSHFIRSCIEKNIPVLALIRPTSSRTFFQKNNIPVIEFDGDIPSLHQDLNQHHCTGIVHLATHFLGDHTSDDIPPLIQSNITFGTQIIEASLKTSIQWILNIGTFWQHHDQDDHYTPTNLYAATKQAFSDILLYYHHAHHLTFTELILNDTYGPNDTRKKLMPLLLSKPTTPLSLSPGEQYLELTHIEDILSALHHTISTLESPHKDLVSNQKFRVSSGEKLTLKQVVETVESVLGTKLPITWGGRPYREREIMVPWQGGNPLPGWKPTYTLYEGLKQLVSP